jgi:hypothetical protein
MNPLGSFSFGKIIKTFLPGLIAAAGPAAKRNLARYQESFLWFLIGSVHFHDVKKA